MSKFKAILFKYPIITGVLVVAGFMVASYHFGLEILNPKNISWLMADIDGAQYYLGWLFFRNEPWAFPLGLIQGYFAPIGTSIGLTDSVPLLAFPFKLISGILPSDFQYFGIWIYVSYILQAVFAYLLMGTVCENRSIRLISALFFVISPVMIFRMKHVALASHWIILAALWRYFVSIDRDGFKKYSIYWILIVGIAGMLHTYLGTMVLLIAIASVTKEWLITKRLSIKKASIAVIGLIFILLLEWWLIGFFSFGLLDSGLGGFGFYSLNLNALFNSLGTSRWFSGLELSDARQYEGYAYLGLGMLLIGVVAVGLFFGSLTKNEDRKESLNILWSHLPLLLLSLGLFLFALSNRISWGDNLIVVINLHTGFQVRVLDQLRASGRFFWPVYYLLIFVLLAFLIRKLPGKVIVPLLVVCLLVQVVELKTQRPENYDQQEYQNYLSDPDWEKIVQHFEMIIPMPPYEWSLANEQDYKNFSYLAASHNKQVATGYVARYSNDSVKEQRIRIGNELRVGEPDPNALYVFTDKSIAMYLSNLKEFLRCHRLNDYFACYSNELDPILKLVVDLNKYQPMFEYITLVDYLRRYQNDLVLIVAMDEASQSLTSELKDYLSARGSRIRELGFRDSYAAVLYQDHLIYEEMSNHSAVEKQWLNGDQVEYPGGILEFREDINLFSAGRNLGNRALIQIDGKLIGDYGRGMNVIVLTELFNAISCETFDTYTGDQGLICIDASCLEND